MPEARSNGNISPLDKDVNHALARLHDPAFDSGPHSSASGPDQAHVLAVG